MKRIIQPALAPNSKIYKKQVDVSDGGLRFRIECKKATTAYDILSEEKFFYTPRLIECDESKGLLVFERIKTMEPISADLDEIWFCRIGELLGIIHQKLHLPRELSIIRQKDKGEKGIVYVHGDFMPNNLCISKGRLVVFDWGVCPWISELYTKASPAVDICAFIAPWWVPQWFDFGFPTVKLRLFLKTYYEVAGIGADAVGSWVRKLDEGFAMHRIYHHKEILKRPPGKRPLHHIKMFLNILRTKHGVLNV